MAGELVMPRPKLLVMFFTRSFGQINFITTEDRDELIAKLLGDRIEKMIHVTGSSEDTNDVVDQWLDPIKSSDYEIGLLVIRKPPSGRIAQPVMRIPGGN